MESVEWVKKMLHGRNVVLETAIEKKGRGGDQNPRHIATAVKKVSYRSGLCNITVAEFETSDKLEHYFRRMKCSKWWCPTCGGTNGLLHKQRIEAIYNRLVPNNIALRQIVFTLPKELRQHFKNRKALDSLLNIVRRLIEREFGVRVSEKQTKKGREVKYRLNKGVIAYLHLFGGGYDFDPFKFNPHINIHIVERKSNLASSADLDLPDEQFSRLRRGYIRALKAYVANEEDLWKNASHIYKKIDMAVIDYRTKYDDNEVFNAINYMARPLGHNVFKPLMERKDYKKLHFLMIELKAFRHIRYWGGLSDGKYKEFLIYLAECKTINKLTRPSYGFRLIDFMSDEMFERIFEREFRGRSMTMVSSVVDEMKLAYRKYLAKIRMRD